MRHRVGISGSRLVVGAATSSHVGLAASASGSWGRPERRSGPRWSGDPLIAKLAQVVAHRVQRPLAARTGEPGRRRWPARWRTFIWPKPASTVAFLRVEPARRAFLCATGGPCAQSGRRRLGSARVEHPACARDGSDGPSRSAHRGRRRKRAPGCRLSRSRRRRPQPRGSLAHHEDLREHHD
jgi:hypothetical protein